MTEHSESYPRLASLIGGWFHQDFDLAGDTLEEIVAAYKKVHSSKDWNGARAEFAKFLQGRGDAQVRKDFVRLFQPGIDVEAWGTSTRQWLLRVAELL